MSGQKDGVNALKKQKVGLISLIAIMYCACAAGAFGVEEMITASGPGMTIIMLLVFPLIWAVPFCMGVAELGAIMPDEGGSYVWVKRTLGEFWGFIGTFLLAISFYVANAVYIVLSVGYLSYFVELTVFQAFCIKVILIAIFTAINLMGIQEVGKVSTFLTIIVIAAFALVAIVGFLNWNQNPMEPFVPKGGGMIESIGGCASLCIWMYCGYISIPNIAGEVDNPQLIPKAVLLSLPLITATYVLPTIGGLASVGNWESWTVDGSSGGVGFSSVLTQYMGPAMGIVFCVVAIASQLAIFNSQLATGSRGFFVLADDNLCPKFLRKVSRKKGVPYVSVLLYTAVTLALMEFEFTALVLLEVIFGLATYVLVCIALIKMRKLYPVEERKGLFVIPGGKAGLYYCGLLPILVCVIVLLLNGTDYFLGGMLLIPIAVLFYIIFKRFYGGLHKTDPNLYPINGKTKLARGDLSRFGAFALIIGVYSMISVPFFNWYEGDWGQEYYLEEYGSGLFSNFDGMLKILLIYGIVMAAAGIALSLLGRKYDPVQKEVDLNEDSGKLVL
ncbi:APC family permease [Anaerovorax odorimutans]|uniref:APC family permease n=1 Tax=Anaerovorax odorimutans TaxID=109327 RepID=A0ABT1RQX3_9FIRM|nr:APC family permease [Anaerovorax odorimutans]MCQ4637593.1 APC family permease [Anaerovorax odorimutans]